MYSKMLSAKRQSQYSGLNMMCSTQAAYIVINMLRPRQDCRHFTDDIIKCISLYEVWISLKISTEVFF